MLRRVIAFVIAFSQLFAFNNYALATPQDQLSSVKLMHALNTGSSRNLTVEEFLGATPNLKQDLKIAMTEEVNFGTKEFVIADGVLQTLLAQSNSEPIRVSQIQNLVNEDVNSENFLKPVDATLMAVVLAVLIAVGAYHVGKSQGRPEGAYEQKKKDEADRKALQNDFNVWLGLSHDAYEKALKDEKQKVSELCSQLREQQKSSELCGPLK